MRFANKKPGARVRIVLGNGMAFGPGKADILAAIAKTHTLTGAASTIRMSYRRAWLLVDELNRIFEGPLVRTSKGGKGGGGDANLTPLGHEVLSRYRSIMQKVDSAIGKDMGVLRRKLRRK